MIVASQALRHERRARSRHARGNECAMVLSMGADPTSIATALRRAESVAACAEIFGAAILPFGFDTFSCGEIDLNDRDLTLFAIVAWPEAVQKFYFDNNLMQNDPVIDTLSRRDTPFTWEDMRADRAIGQFGTRNLQMLADFGYVAGLVVPFPHGEGRFGLVSLIGRRGDISRRDYAVLELMSTCLYHRARYLAPRRGFAVPPLGLSQRQIDCLRLVADGFSDREIAQHLSISIPTAHEYVEGAKTRLKARTRAAAVARALSYGIIV